MFNLKIISLENLHLAFFARHDVFFGFLEVQKAEAQ